MSAVANFLTGIAGPLSGAFGFAGNIVLNQREKNAAAFALETQKISNDFAASEFERNQKMLILQNQFNNEQARIKDQERADTLKLVAIVGLFATLIMVIIVAAKRSG